MNKALALKRRAQLFKEKCKRDIWFWLTTFVKTYDEKDSEQPVKDFPAKEYLKVIVHEYNKPDKVLAIAKSRQIMASWLFAAIGLHLCLFFDYRKVVVLSKTKDDTYQIIDRAKFIYNSMPGWLRRLLPLARKMKDMPMDGLFIGNNSQMIGLAHGGEKIRSHVASLIILDEFAWQEEISETYTTCLPCAKKIVLISSANDGFFMDLTGIKDAWTETV
jgi:hypothetical protein